MALDKSIFSDESIIEQANPYLADDKKGMELISRIISAEPIGSTRAYFQIDELIDRQLLSSTGTLKLNKELELYNRLMLLSDRLVIPEKYRILKKCTIIGVGGKFSSGKSAFLNTLIGGDVSIQLPEEQTPSTAVPTYILHGSQERAYAYTIKGSRLSLDGDAVEAVSHAFQNQYGLGLAQYLSFLTVTSPSFMENIALLDTPGYNKSDSSMLESYSDESKAFSQLRSIDFLIWLTDVTNGTLTSDDIVFIRKLGITSKILILVNKCDLKTPEEVDSVLQRTQVDAIKAGLPVFSVVAYSSYDPALFGGKEKVEEFFEYAKKCETRVEDVEKSLSDISDLILKSFDQKRKVLIEAQKMIGSAIENADDILYLKGLVNQYGQISVELSSLQQSKKKFKKTVENIYRVMAKL